MGNLIARVRGLSPLGPIFGKELRTTARRKRTYILRFFYLAALLLPLLLCALSYSSRSYYYETGVAARAQRNAEMGAAFFQVFSFFTWFAMGLVGPILTSTAINSERLHKTLPVLLMTPITAWQIVSGKLFSRAWIALTLIGLTLPMLAVLRLLGGVEIEQIVGVLSVCVATVLMTAALGLLFSSLMNRAYAVILLSYGVLFFLWGLVPLIFALLVSALRWWSWMNNPVFEDIAKAYLPWFTLGYLAFEGSLSVSWHWAVAVQLGIATLLLICSALLVRRMARREHEGSATSRPAAPPPMMMPPMPAMAGGAPAGAAVAGGEPLRRLGEREVAENPVLWRELRRPLLAKRWQRITATLVILGLLLLLYGLLGINDELGDDEVQGSFACVFCGLLTLLTSIIAATSISQEKEGDTWTLLLTTPLSGRQVVLGKLGGLLRRLLWPSILILGHFLLFTLGGSILPITLVVVVWLIFSTNFLWLATGMYLSLRIRTTTMAVILNLLLPVVLYGVIPILWAIAGEIVNEDEVMEAGGLHVPYVYMVNVINDLEPDRYARYTPPNYGPGYVGYAPRGTPTIWMPVLGYTRVYVFVMTAGAVGVAHLLAGVALIMHTSRRFDRIIGRAPQVSV